MIEDNDYFANLLLENQYSLWSGNGVMDVLRVSLVALIKGNKGMLVVEFLGSPMIAWMACHEL